MNFQIKTKLSFGTGMRVWAHNYFFFLMRKAAGKMCQFVFKVILAAGIWDCFFHVFFSPIK